MAIIPSRENKNIEFKEKLTSAVHLKEDKKQKLAAQMKYRLEVGDGTAVYIIGVDDAGRSKGLADFEFEETLAVLKAIATEINAEVAKVERFTENGDQIGRVIIKRRYAEVRQHIIVATTGHVAHGKSTLIATLMTGKADQSGKSWLYLNVLPHEIERGLSADLHFTLYGFKNGKPLHMKNPLDKTERARLVEQADKIVSFVDTVGHEPWLRTTIRGLVGQSIDYGLLIVAADDGVTYLTKEHLGLLLVMNIPIVICVTKTDKVGQKRVDETLKQIEELMKFLGKVPFQLNEQKDIDVVIDKLNTTVPILKTSAVTLEGYDLLDKLLLALPEREKDLDRPFIMFIDRMYNVTGVGTVVSGTIRQGRLKAGSDLLLGPDASGKFKPVKAKSIEMHYHPLSEANAGLIVGIAIRGVTETEVERGMVLCDKTVEPKAVKTFDAEILVLTHPTLIADGYEPVLNCQTVSESVKFEMIDKKYLKAGETGKVRMTFKYQPQFVKEGDNFIFREGKAKGIGTITKIVKYA